MGPYRSRALAALFGWSILLSSFMPVQAQPEYPTRPIELIVPSGVGGSTDVTARAMAAVAEDHLGVPIVVRNLPGARGVIGASELAKAEADGYSLLWANPSPIIAAQEQLGSPSDFMADFQASFIPIAQMIERDSVLVVEADSPYGTIDELLNEARSNPGEIVFARQENVRGDPALQLEDMAGVEFSYIPFGSTGVALALVGGRVDALHTSIPTALPGILGDELKPLAVSGSERNSRLPDVPTYEELGYRVFSSDSIGLFAPTGTARDVVRKLEAAMRAVSEDPEYLVQLDEFGEQPAFLEGEAYGQKLLGLFEGMQAVAANGGSATNGGGAATGEVPGAIAAFRASRTFVGPHQFPPEEFAAYGIVAFPVRPSAAELLARSLAVCQAYWEVLAPASELFTPIREQLVTVWPVGTDAISEQLNRDHSDELCERAVDHYHLATAQQAIYDARRTEPEGASRVLNGRGPFLLLWRPASTKGNTDTLVLSADLSPLFKPHEFRDAFRKWQLDVESKKEFWPPIAGTETHDSYIDRVRRWGDTWGPTIVSVFGSFRGGSDP